jgi:hypothetical protein
MTELRRGVRWGLGLLVAAGLLVMAGGAQGQDPSNLPGRGGDSHEVQMVAPSPTGRTFGTATSTAHVVGAPEFDPVNGIAGWGYFGRAKTSDFTMLAGLRLPSGAVVTSIELEGCDESGSSQLQFSMARARSPSGTSTLVTPNGVTGIPEIPGCGFFSVAPLPTSSPLVIDNDDFTYQIQVTAPTSTTRVAAVRVFYTLQVSPAPAVATFSDVPTSHPFFRFIEALARSGITSGCGNDNFCPDAPLTRGQMAVFLAIGLGLHFAP